MKPQHVKYIWYDDAGMGHNPYAAFRKTVIIGSGIQTAQLSLFADTAYQLFINGSFIEFGPVRFDPRYPQYDTHDILPFLKQGTNVIAVLVNFIGHKNFKSIPSKAGLAARGSILLTDGRAICLDTGNSSWKCLQAMEYTIPSPRLSFALNDAEIFHQGLEQAGWKEPDFDDGSWPEAVELKDQDSWGALEPRYIPFMSGKEITYPISVKAFPLRNREQRYSFTVDLSFNDRVKPETGMSSFIAYSTWMYSPRAQTVITGAWLGEIWLNGQPVDKGLASSNKNMRYNCRLDLNEGWNYYFGYTDVTRCTDVSLGIMDHFVGIPKDSGIVISADREPDTPYIFRHSAPITRESYEKNLKNKVLPYDPKEQLEGIGGWTYATATNSAHSPCIETQWDDYGEPFESVSFKEIYQRRFSFSCYPEGFCLLMDLDHMHLFFPIMKLEGVKGAIVDITYGEQLNQDNTHIRIESRAPLGDRVICTRDRLEWMPVHPRGARFVSITIRNITSDVTVSGISFRSANYPAPHKGRFQCSDPLLNSIWELGRRTQETNMEDAYVDCTGRERGMYARDTIIQYHNNLAAFGDQLLMKRCLELFGQSPDDTGKFRAVYPNTGSYTIADFALNMVEGYYNYYENTGDLALIKKCWTSIVKNIKWFHNLADEREDLLLDSEWHTKRAVYSEYGGLHGDNDIVPGYMDNTGIHCVFSCMYLLAMKSALKLADVLGDDNEAGYLARRIGVVQKSISEGFWDAGRKCFSDNLNKTTHSVHANIFAVSAGAVEAEQLQAVKQYISGQLKTLFVNGIDPKEHALVSPHFSFYIFRGLYALGLFETAEGMMKQGWGWMLSQGMKTCPEFFRTEYSLCHAWSASPTYYLSKNVLGIHFPNLPDTDTVEIRVNAFGPTWAEGSYPHPRGVVEVRWHMEKGIRIFDLVKAPDGVTVTIIG